MIGPDAGDHAPLDPGSCCRRSRRRSAPRRRTPAHAAIIMDMRWAAASSARNIGREIVRLGDRLERAIADIAGRRRRPLWRDEIPCRRSIGQVGQEWQLADRRAMEFRRCPHGRRRCHGRRRRLVHGQRDSADVANSLTFDAAGATLLETSAGSLAIGGALNLEAGTMSLAGQFDRRVLAERRGAAVVERRGSGAARPDADRRRGGRVWSTNRSATSR